MTNKKIKHYADGVINDQAADSDFVSQSRPGGLCTIIPTLTEKQRQDVINIGFGGMLELQLSKCYNHSMLKWLVQNFNGTSRMLSIDNFHQFVVTADDVYDVFMLPRNEGSPVPCYSKSDDFEFANRFGDKYDIKSRSPLWKLPELITGSLREGGDDFKRVFVLYCLGSLFCPTSNRLLSINHIKAVEDVEKIAKFDWCTLVLEKLCDSISSYHRNSTKHIGGCLILLQLVYFHRLRWRGVSEPQSIPLIKHWTDAKVNLRCVQEAKAGFYGSGELINGVFPLTENGLLKRVDFINENTNKGSIDDRYKDLMQLLLSIQKDCNEFAEKYLNKLMKIIEENRQATANQTTKDTSEPEISDTQFFMNEKLHRFIDNVVKHVMLAKELADGPNFDLLTPEPVVYETNLSDEGVFDEGVVNLGADDCCLFREGSKEQVGCDDELNNAMNSVSSKGKTVGRDSGSVFWYINDDIGYVSKLVSTNKIYRRMPQTHIEVLDFVYYDGEGCVDVNHYYRNKVFLFLVKSDLLSILPNCQIYAPVVNAWCLEVNSDCSLDERYSRFVFNLEHSNILRQLLEGEIDVVQANNQFVVGWSQWISVSVDSLLSVDMIFIPFCLRSHYAAVAINFVDSKLQYLDNRKYSNGMDMFIESAKVLCNSMSKFLESKNHPRAKDILSYEFENIPFKWQTNKVDNDCGVYMMHHMKHFSGKPYTSPDLTMLNTRLILRAEFCAIIILSNCNEVRHDVIEKVYQFYMNKTTLIQSIIERKRQAALRVKEEKRKLAAEKLKEICDDGLGKGKRKVR